MSFTDRHGTTFTPQAGSAFAFCSLCREAFNSVAAFDKHLKNAPKQRGKAQHLDPAEIGMVRNSRGLWVTALMPTEALSPTQVAASPST
jgi:hypothetical protein